MFTKEKAVRYFIVAWVKDWNMITYLRTILEIGTHDKIDEEELAALCQECPFLPKEVYEYLGSNGKRSPRVWVAETYPVLNTKLWDAKSMEERLKLSEVLMGLKYKRATDRRGSIGNYQDRHLIRSTNNRYISARLEFNRHQDEVTAIKSQNTGAVIKRRR